MYSRQLVFNIFNTVNLFTTTTTKQNPTTQHALGWRSAEIYKVPPTGKPYAFRKIATWTLALLALASVQVCELFSNYSLNIYLIRF